MVSHLQESQEYPLFLLGDDTKVQKPLEVTVQVDGHQLVMEVDTGASLSLISHETYRRFWPSRPLEASSVNLRTYSGDQVGVLGGLNVDVSYGDQNAELPLLVVEGSGPSLFGRDWLARIKLDWKAIYMVTCHPVEALLSRHRKLFEEGLGTLQGHKAKLYVDPQAIPKFCKARSVPYAMRGKVEEELHRLVQEGILEPIQYADWAAPIVPVWKKDKESVRVCGDFKLTVNKVARLDRYPIPRIEDLLAKLAGGKQFSKLDMSQAYQQLLLDESSRQYVVINTHKGLFRYSRLPFGVSSAPGIFQRVMENLLQDIPGVVVYIDDVLITGPDESGHIAALEEVLRRMEQAGLRLSKGKCLFMAPSVEYLGYKIDAEGLHPLPEKVRAIERAPKPRNTTELKAYLGLLTYYGRFLPNLSTVLSPLYRLLRQDVCWRWTSKQQRAFIRSKQLLTSAKVLVHYDPRLDLVVAGDASAYEIGAVLSHKMPNGEERPVAFASRTLSSAERNYSQVEKEALACVFAIKKFHSYIFGRSFTLVTDHKPLLTLFGENKPISPQASARVQRWALTLAMYNYQIAFKPTTAHSNADGLSRLPLPEAPSEVPVPPEFVLLVEHLLDAPVKAHEIRTWTRRDPLLSRVKQFIQSGWPATVESQLRPYWTRRCELTVLDGCIVWGSRVVVPSPGRQRVLQQLHEGHPGMARMKGLARMHMWWPRMDEDVTQVVRSCHECQKNQATPPQAPLQPWSWPKQPWSRLHLDFAGPMLNHMFLVVVDAHTKWIEVVPMSNSTSFSTIQQLRTLFAQFGIPRTVVTDNGPCFISEEFREFMIKNGIHHIRSSPYHPASNGLAERAVRVFKEGFKKMKEGTISDKIARFLFSYRNLPHSTTGVSPAELMFGRQLRS